MNLALAISFLLLYYISYSITLQGVENGLWVTPPFYLPLVIWGKKEAIQLLECYLFSCTVSNTILGQER